MKEMQTVKRPNHFVRGSADGIEIDVDDNSVRKVTLSLHERDAPKAPAEEATA